MSSCTKNKRKKHGLEMKEYSPRVCLFFLLYEFGVEEIRSEKKKCRVDYKYSAIEMHLRVIKLI